MEVKILKPEERNYTYSQSQQISMQTGCIGHLRADMDTSGEGFFSSWDDFRKDLKTQEFKDEFDELINELRKEGGFLKNRTTLAKFCNTHPEASFGKDVLGRSESRSSCLQQLCLYDGLKSHKANTIFTAIATERTAYSHLEKATNGSVSLTVAYNSVSKSRMVRKSSFTTAWDEKSNTLADITTSIIRNRQ